MSNAFQRLFGLSAEDAAAGDGWRVTFVAEYGNYVKLAMIAAFALLLYLVVRSYRREGDAPPVAKAFLAGLRLLVIVLAFLVLLRPGLVLSFTETVYPTVAVLLDDSESMSQRDRYAGGADAAYGEQVARRLEVAPDTLAELSRLDLVRRFLPDREGLAGLADTSNLILLRFAPEESPPGDARGVDYVRHLADLPALGTDASPRQFREAEGEIRKALAGLSGAGGRTDLAAAVEGALAMTVGQRLAAVVIVTDGQVTSEQGRAALSGARARADERRADVYAVAVGDTTRRHRNLGVGPLRAPTARVRRGSRVRFTVRLQHSLLDGRTVVVQLQRRRPGEEAWRDVMRSDPVTLSAEESAAGAADAPGPGDPAEQKVDLLVQPDVLGRELGDFVFRAVVEPESGEANADDNAAETALRVCDDKIHVLLVGCGGWEFQYLRSFLLRERREGPEGEAEDVFRVSVWQQDADPGLNLDASTGMKLAHLPKNLEELIGSPLGEHPGYDMVMLYDPLPTKDGFDEPFIDLLRTFVQDHGGGLCFLAGRRHTESALLDTQGMGGLRDLLPVEIARNTPDIAARIQQRTPRPYPVLLTPAGVDHPVMRLGARGAVASAAWDDLPGLYWSHPVRQVKPLARVLAINSSPFRRTGTKTAEPVVAIHASGAGRVLYIGADTTWRWRSLEDARYYRTFWRDVIRFLAPTRVRQVAVTAGGAEHQLGQRVAVEVEAYDETYEPVTRETYDVVLVEAGGGMRVLRTVGLRAVDPERRPGLYRGALDDLPEGKYVVAPARPIPEERVDVARFEVVRRRAEQRRPEADLHTLRYPTGLASRPESFLRIDEAGQLPERIAPEPQTFVSERTIELLDSRPLAGTVLGLFVLLLAIEWIVRKRYNMT